MKNKVKSVAVRVAVSSLLAVFSLGASAAHANGIVASATGGYEVTYGGTTREVGFTAKRDKKGRTRGQVQLSNLDNGMSLHFNVDCLRVEDNVATIGGVITERDLLFQGETALPYFWLRVADNGESEVSEDMVSFLVVYDDANITCEDELYNSSAESYFDVQFQIEDGNIQVNQNTTIDIP